MSERFILSLLWIFSGTVAVLLCFQYIDGAYWNGRYIPVGNDAYYHARRIIDAVREPSGFYEFDPNIYAPEGSWVSWPYAYDLALSWLTRGVMYVTGGREPINVLIYFPLAWVYVNAGLMLLLGLRLNLSLPLLVLLMACFSLSPLTQSLHGLGQLDHHLVEYSFVLAALLTSLWWAQRPDSRWRAVILGSTLGAAPAFHNALFVLHLPFLLGLVVLWLRGIRLTRPAVAALAVGLVGSTLFVLLWSEPFRQGFFSYYYLSWFHLYVSACTVVFAACLMLLPVSARTAAWLLLAGVVMALPLANEFLGGLQYIGADIPLYEDIVEVRSFFATRDSFAASMVSNARLYSGLVFLSPFVVAGLSVYAWRTSDTDLILLSVFAVFGLALLLAQWRFHYFGSFALYLPLLVAIDRFRRQGGRARNINLAAVLSAYLVVAVAHVPVAKVLGRAIPVTGVPFYGLVLPVLQTLKTACEEDPGVVLADRHFGHHIRYFTDCSVAANSMMISPQQVRKAIEANALLNNSAENIRLRAPWVDYVLVMNNHNYGERGNNYYGETIKRELLFLDGPPPPPGYRLIQKLVAYYPQHKKQEALAALYKVVD